MILPEKFNILPLFGHIIIYDQFCQKHFTMHNYVQVLIAKIFEGLLDAYLEGFPAGNK